jgi:hypothetical protein
MTDPTEREAALEIADDLRNSDCPHNDSERSVYRVECKADCNRCVADALRAARKQGDLDARIDRIKTMGEIQDAARQAGREEADALWVLALDALNGDVSGSALGWVCRRREEATDDAAAPEVIRRRREGL